ncbi:MAG: LarC family nickel insertion protein, partial [Planctomycetes bacterium]|nr:LarC family nickel insertion protein [Planctomycetota bacterium]
MAMLQAGTGVAGCAPFRHRVRSRSVRDVDYGRGCRSAGPPNAAAGRTSLAKTGPTTARGAAAGARKIACPFGTTELATMSCLYFDCYSGAAGDMLVAALLDLGAPFQGLREDLATLGVPGFSIAQEKRWQGGLAGTHFVVRLDPAANPPRRNLRDIVALIEASALPPAVKANAIRVFRRIGAAEAKVHGCALDDVHFHEVGALDSIADVVGFCALHYRLGSPRLFASPIAVGEGFVKTEHGLLPIPAMATLELLCGVPVESGGLKEELCTPTGAALLSTLCEGFGRDFTYVPRQVGYGLGTRVRESPPNAVRVVACEMVDLV